VKSSRAALPKNWGWSRARPSRKCNEQPLRDAIQLKMADVSEKVSLTVIQPNGEAQIFDIEKDTFEPLGLRSDAELFDGVTRCQNKCPFCFVDQLPPRFRSGEMGKKPAPHALCA
jgi:NifB/MoaA-like Fe-S oxidoreductase